MRAQADVAATRQRRSLAKLDDDNERENLLRTDYAEAKPVDLLRSEQDRLTLETERVERHLEVAETSHTDTPRTRSARR